MTATGSPGTAVADAFVPPQRMSGRWRVTSTSSTGSCVTSGTISAMGYVSIRTRDLTASITNAVDVLGLRLLENTATKAYLSAADTAQELVYTQDPDDGLDHFGLVVDDLDQLEAIKEKVQELGLAIIAHQPIEANIEHGFAFVGPAGFVWHVYVSIRYLDYRGGSFGPDRYGHINYKAPNTIEQVKFLIDVFDFRISDRIGYDDAFFLRCNTDHHGVAIMKGEVGLHHHAWQTQSIVDLGRLGDRLARRGERLVWGPVRHGAGHNIAAYFLEPSGALIEVYTDMEQIYDKERDMIRWEADDLYWVNQWDGQVPSTMRDFGIAPLVRDPAPHA